MYGGKRRFDPDGHKCHFCCSNEGLFQETLRRVRAEFDVYDFEGVSVIPPGSYTSICQCPLCAGKDDPQRGPRGSLANHVWGFVNRVAKEIAKTHPHKLIYCCAYGANSLPPTNIDKLDPNVQVVIVGGRPPKSGATQQAEIRAFRESWLASGFHHPLRFAHLYAGLSHAFEADPTVTSYVTALRDAGSLPKAEALAALVALADGSCGKLTDLQQSTR